MPTKKVALVIGVMAFLIAGYCLLNGTKKDLPRLSAARTPAAAKAKVSVSEPIAAIAPSSEEVLETAEKTYQKSKVSLVKEILQSRNDNDPRMDSELKDLDEDTKRQLIELYRTREPEDLNGRGTIVFLLGRNIRSANDIKFFQEVVSEAPCLSLNDCSSLPDTHPSDDDHEQGADQITLSYPKHVVISSFEKLAKVKNLSRSIRSELMTTLEIAAQSAEPIVAQRAARLVNSLRE